jgi:hypothetical protein
MSNVAWNRGLHANGILRWPKTERLPNDSDWFTVNIALIIGKSLRDEYTPNRRIVDAHFTSSITKRLVVTLVRGGHTKEFDGWKCCFEIVSVCRIFANTGRALRSILLLSNEIVKVLDSRCRS